MKISTGHEDRFAGFRRLVITLVVLAIILMVTGFLAVRMEGGSKFVQDWLGKRVGLDLTAEHTRIGWPYVLVLEGVQSNPGDDGPAPLVSAREVRVGLRLNGNWRVTILQGAAQLVQGSDGTWGPAALGRLGSLDVPDVTQISRVTAGFRRRVALDIRDSSLEWVDARGMTRAAARGVDFRMVPVRVPERRLYYYTLSADSLTREAMRPRKVTEEWLAGEGLATMRISPEISPQDEIDSPLRPLPEVLLNRENEGRDNP